MKLHVYLAFIVDAKRGPRAGVLVATDSVAAMSKAVAKCKATFGPTGKVSRIQHIAEADASFMQRTQLLQVLSEFDQVAFVAVETEKLSRQFDKLLQQLTDYVQKLQAKITG